MKKYTKAKLQGLLPSHYDNTSAPEVEELNSRLEIVSQRLEEVSGKLNKLDLIAQQNLDIARAMYDNVTFLRNRLREVRQTNDYMNVFKNKTPLITIRIATYNRADDLINKALKSVIAQTYQNFEVIVVGDHVTDDTEEKIKKLNDKRIKFVNLASPSLYPDNVVYRWMVGGAPPMNLATYLAKGDWIAPLDDDDEFTPDHLEKLLKHALSTKSEVVYGALEQRNINTGETKIIWSDPPKSAAFGWQGGIYMKLLNFFEYDQASWVMREVGDWNMCRRMLEAGVKYSAIDDIVGRLNMVPVHEKKAR